MKKDLKIIGIIAEYNPLHLGHVYQLKAAKEKYGADYVIVALSGDFCQRGIPAILDKFTRTKLALSLGADLVLEIPVVGATSSAETFARSGVSLLNSLGIVDTLLFGAETADPLKFSEAADFFNKESEDYKTSLGKFLKEGHSFPKARSLAFAKTKNEKDSDFLSSPNNILGVEYLRALKEFNSKMSFIPMERNFDFKSSSKIRKAIRTGDISLIKKEVPTLTLRDIKDAKATGRLALINDFSLPLHLSLISNQDFEDFLDGNYDLSKRTLKYRNEFIDTKDFGKNVLKSKNLTLTRVMRYLTHIMLNIKTSDYECLKALSFCPYAHVLGVKKESRSLLSLLKQESKVPVFTSYKEAISLLSQKPGSGSKPGSKSGSKSTTQTIANSQPGIPTAEPSALFLYKKDLYASDLYEAVLTQKTGAKKRDERKNKFIVI